MNHKAPITEGDKAMARHQLKERLRGALEWTPRYLAKEDVIRAYCDVLADFLAAPISSFFRVREGR